MRLLLFLITQFCTLSLLAQARYVSVDSIQIWVFTQGLENRQAGQPVVVFENGHGVPLDNWERVWQGMGDLAPLVAYDRTGIGQSEAVEEIPTMEAVSTRLVRLLQALEVEPPYILVGHSLGGIYARGFAIYYPELMAGLILVDPADFTETMENRKDYYEVLNWEEASVDSLVNSFVDKRDARHAKAEPPQRREGQYLEAIRAAEFPTINAHPLPNIPVHMLGSGRFAAPPRHRSSGYDTEAVFRAKQAQRTVRWMDVVQSVDKGMLLYSGDAGHYIQWDDPDLVIASIRLVLMDYELLKKE